MTKSIVALARRFNRDRRGVIMLIFAGSLLPLCLLVGLAIDYSFYVQARSQFSLAGDAAATYAIREATATYALENQADKSTPSKYPNTTADAIAAGNTAGNNWFVTQIAPLPTSYVYGGSPHTPTSTSASGIITNVTNTNCAGSTGGFSAAVNYIGVYPPFFDFLFKSSANWYVTGISKACTSYNYSEVLLLLDTSGSMLIGANQSDINALDWNTACMETYPNNTISLNNTTNSLTPYQATTVVAGNAPFGTGYLSAGGFYQGDTQARGNVDFTKVTNYVAASSTDTNGHCSTSNMDTLTTTNSHGVKSTSSVKAIYNSATTNTTTNGQPFAPCAFACHTTNIKASDGYYEDYYGEARRLNPNQTSSANGGVTLRIDAVFAATEQVIEDMQSSEQANGQYTVGVYQFNDNASPIVDGTVGTDVNQEATADLSTALSSVEADDWMITPTETAIPALADNPYQPSQEANADYTDFATAMYELLNGGMTNGTVGSSPVATNSNTLGQPQGHGATGGVANNKTTLPALAASTGTTAGTTAATPLKVLIIVTDGLDDTNPGVNYYATTQYDRFQGPMTSVLTEATTAGTCKLYKNLGFTVYILDIAYYPVPNNTYYSAYNAATSTSYVATDYGGAGNAMTHTYASSAGGDIENWNEGDATNNTFAPTYPVVTKPDLHLDNAPDQASLEACGGTLTSATKDYQTYYFPATSSSQITTAMNSILSSALNGAIRISQ